MRWINRTMVLTAVLSFSSLAVVAQDQQCTEDYLNETYTKWYEPYKARDTDPKQKDLAYQIAKEYANKCPNEFPDNTYAKALKSYVQVYEKAQVSGKLATDFETAVKSKNYAEQIRLGKQLVVMPSNADNAVLYIIMGSTGLGEPNLLSESAQAAKKAIELIEAGKPVTPAYQTKDQALAAMNYVIAKSTMKTSPTDAIPYFIKAAKYESDLKKSPLIYNELAAAYGEGPVAKFAKDYQAVAEAGKSVDSPEAKIVVANLNQALDRQIDAFARAAAVSTSPADKKAFMDVLAAVYKDRNKKDPAENELNSLVAAALSRPLPDPPTPITALPSTTSTPATNGSPAPGGATPGATGPASASSPKTTGTVPAAGTSSTMPKPTSTPTPKPRPRRSNHRRQ